jgi:hypothetical protein
VGSEGVETYQKIHPFLTPIGSRRRHLLGGEKDFNVPVQGGQQIICRRRAA